MKIAMTTANTAATAADTTVSTFSHLFHPPNVTGLPTQKPYKHMPDIGDSARLVQHEKPHALRHRNGH